MTTIFIIGLFSCSYLSRKEVAFTISNQSNDHIDSIRIHIPSAYVTIKSLQPDASATTILQYDENTVPKVDGSFLYTIYYKDGDSKQGSFGY